MLVLGAAFNVTAQLQLPRESPRATVAQTVGDTNISIVYHRPSVKGRKVFGGELVPFGEVWRTGANDATIVEISENVTVNGQPLAAGKYTLFTIPTANEWTVIFNKEVGQWGTEYKQAQDALRFTVRPQTVAELREQMTFEFMDVKPTSANLVLMWERVKLPLAINVGDVNARVLAKARKAVAEAKPDDFRTPLGLANFVLTNKMKDSYAEAVQFVDKSLKVRE